MKHVLVIDTVTSISPSLVDELRFLLSETVDTVLGENSFCTLIANQPSAIRGVYRIFNAIESLSPDELQSAT